MGNFLDYSNHRSNSFVYHNIRALFSKVETVVFVLLCLVLIVTSKANHKITNNISMAIASVAVPFSSAISMPLNSVVNLATGFQELMNAKNQNAKLLQENHQLKSLYIKSLNISQENKQLKDIVRYASVKSTQFTAAHLISRSHQSYSHNAFISAGENRNIKENNVVIGKDSMIGRVYQVGSKKSRILLVSDINSRIPIIVSGSGVKGILAGDNGEIMEILYLGKDHPVEVGDLVFTSGDGDTIPPGFLVGSVVKIGKYSAFAKMAENVNSLDLVGVVNY
jgi:rod shape-determining protein MreC